ncbi:MAG: VOC family protein, partial [Planctomycetota bacterium]
RFYSGLLEMPGQRVSPGRHYYDLGGTILAVYDPVADGDSDDAWKHHPNQYVYIGVDDVDAAFRRARELGATFVGERVESMPWGERLFYARDPSGNPISLVDAETLFLGHGD